MGKTVNLTLRVPEELHIKMRILAAVQNKNMSELFISWLEKQNVSVPEVGKTEKIDKRKNVKTKTTKTKSNINPDYDKEAVKEKILSLKDAGSNPADIARTLEAEGILTATGKTSWNRGTISNMIKGWTAQ